MDVVLLVRTFVEYSGRHIFFPNGPSLKYVLLLTLLGIFFVSFLVSFRFVVDLEHLIADL